MITEFARLNIHPGSEAQFEAAFPAAIKILGASKGYLAHELQRSIETPHQYALIVRWQTLEDHTVGFRGSPAFTEWRAHIGPFLAAAPVVEHFQPIVAAG
jgi:heme-degrading monooxygenase HmoA